MRLFYASTRLIIWSEPGSDRGLLEDIKSSIRAAQGITLLDFAFANQNMRLLDAAVREDLRHYKDVYATGYGLNDDVETKLSRKNAHLYTASTHRKEPYERVGVYTL